MKNDISVDPYSPIPLHYQVEQIIRALIKEEKYLNGELLPTETMFSEKLGISRNTVRQAINKLVSEGLLIRKKGVGTKVLKNQLYTRVSNWFSFTKELQSRGITVKNYHTDLKKVYPPFDVSVFFKITTNVKVVCLERLRGSEELPFVYFISYFNPIIDFKDKDKFTVPLYEILENEFNIIAKSSHEELKAIKADANLCKRLNIPKCNPVLVRKRMVYDQFKRPIEFNIGYYIGEKFTYVLESERKI